MFGMRPSERPKGALEHCAHDEQEGQRVSESPFLET